PFYDDIPAIAPELVRLASEAIQRARTVETKPIETPFGNYDGHTVEHVVNAALQLIDDLRYVDIQLTFRVLCILYGTATTDDEGRRILQSVEALARNDINIWRRYGFAVQKLLQDEVTALSAAERQSLRPVVLMVCRHILDPELQGSTWHFDSVTI